MDNEEPDLIEVYLKREGGRSLTESEQALWDKYRILFPLDIEDILNDGTIPVLIREKQKTPTWEAFCEKHKTQLSTIMQRL